MKAIILVGQSELNRAKEIIAAIDKDTLSSTGKYNLACYYSRLGEKSQTDEEGNNVYKAPINNKAIVEEYFNEALRYLEEAFQIESSVTWAERDPDLAGLRKEKSSEFNRLVEEYGLQKKEEEPAVVEIEVLPLESVRVIGKEYAEKLREENIVSYGDLILQTESAEARAKLAERIGVEIDLITKWARIADLMRITGTDTGNVNLLEASDVVSIAILREKDPDQLCRLLNQVNQSRKYVEKSPDYTTVELWICQANKIEPKVIL